MVTGHEEELVNALHLVASSASESARARSADLTHALVDFAALVERAGADEARWLARRLERHRTIVLDPYEGRNGLFRWLGMQGREVAWSAWLTRCLGDRGLVGDLARPAFVRATRESIARRRLARAADTGSRFDLAMSLPWDDFAAVPWEADGEFAQEEGRIDILARVPGFDTLIGIEVKLLAGWHDQEGDNGQQAARYRRMLHRQTGASQGALVLITARPDFVTEVPGDWIFLTWRDLGRAVRHVLEETRSRPDSEDAWMRSWPLRLGLASLETDLLGLDAAALADPSPGLFRVRALVQWMNYLEGDQ